MPRSSGSMRSRATATFSLLLAAGCAAAPRPAAAPPAPSPLERARAGVVTLRVTGQEWNWKTPWAKQPPWTRSLTGLVVPDHRILVTSPALGNQLLIEAQKMGRDQRTPARLELFDPEGPLALVAVDDPAFWEGLAPLPIAERVPTSGDVTIHRWPRVGQFDSSSGAVRQVRAGRHGFSRTTVLTLDVTTNADAGDGDVMVADGKVVGLTTAKSGDSAAAIAAPVLRQFLAAASGAYPYPGFARAGIAWQELTNPALRDALGLRADEGGVRLTRVLPHGPAAGVLEVGDVILEIAGVPLDPSGQFEHPLYGRQSFGLLLTDGRGPGDTLAMRILRGGERKTVSMVLTRMPTDADRVPAYVVGRGPDYAVLGGLVFQDLSGPYLSTWGDFNRRAPPRLLIANERDGLFPTAEQPRIVLLSSVLPDAVNLGYQDLRDLIVVRVNGRTVGQLDDVRRAFRDPQNGFHVIEFLPGQGPARIVLDVREAKESEARVTAAYGVPDLRTGEPSR
jgi:PDZ domain